MAQNTQKREKGKKPFRWRWPPFGDKGLRRANLALFLAAILLFHFAVYTLGRQFSWYFYTEERYTHEITDQNYDKLSEMEHAVTVRFCMDEEDLLADAVYSLVYKTAEQYAEQHPNKITLLPSLNIYTDHREVAAYKEKVDESSAAISKETVIIESEEDLMLVTMSDFFLLDSERTTRAYNGEEVFCSSFLWVQAETKKHPIVCFTVDHGENVALSALQSKVMLSGYRTEPLNLSADAIPADCEIIVISNPLYDLEVSAPGSLVLSELDRLAAFVADGGKLLVTLDAKKESYGRLQNLRAFLREYGIATESRVVTDPENAVTQDGKVLLAKEVGAETRLLLREPAALTLSGENPKGASVTPKVTSYESALAGDAAGEKVLAATAALPSGGMIFCAATGYLFYNDAMESAVYGNRDFFFGILRDFGCKTTPAGSRILPVASDTLENLTRGESDTVFFVTAAVLPSLILLCALIVMLRRRFR